MSRLEAGFARTDITPHEERQTIYHRSGDLDDKKTPIRDNIFARATAFRNGDQVAIWVTVDLLCVDSRLRNGVVTKLVQEGIPSENVALCATHTHTAPSIVPFQNRSYSPGEREDVHRQPRAFDQHG